ncbi:hypothetical protein WME77_40615 [Sorangium sp. So ce764]|uniref:PEGA domain-containing protein n=1 Tax=Sorangium sp. So ce764 TaxID=3133320 RepID=UPI003F631090
MRRAVRAGWLVTSVLLGSTAVPSSVRGEERAMPVSSESSERERAVRDFEEGRGAHMAGRLEEAELAYLRAWSWMKSYDIAVNLGQVQLRLNKPASAAKYLAYGVRAAGPEIEPERLARMLALLDEAKAQVGAVRLQVTNVADAEVFVDGERVPAEEVKHDIYVEPGEHRIVIRRAGYAEAMIQVAAMAGSREEIATELKPKLATRPGAAGAPVVGKVGEEKTKVPGAGVAVEEPRSWVPVVALGAASAVGLGVGVGFTAASNGARVDVDAQRDAILKARTHCVNPPTATPEQCAELRRTVSRVDTLGNGARVAYATAGALAIAALIYATWPRGRPARAVALEAGPGLNAGGAGIAVTGSW